MKTALVILAAGIGARYGGGIKQLEPVGPNGEIIMDYSIHDAIAAGFSKVVFIIRKSIAEDFQAVIGNRIEETCRRLQALGRRVVLLLDTPKYVEGDPFEGVLMRTIFHQPMPWVGVSAQQHAHNTATERAMIARICAAVPGVQQYDLAEPLLIGGAYPFLDEQGRFLYRDTNHVSTHGSRRVSYPLLEFLLPLMTPEQAPLQKK